MTDRYIQHLNPRSAIDRMLDSQWGREDADDSEDEDDDGPG